MTRLLIVDDNDLSSDMLASATHALFSHVEQYQDANVFLHQHLQANDIILLDIQMPGVDESKLLYCLAQKHCKATLILMGGEDENGLQSAKLLAQEYGLMVAASLLKPFGIEQLITQLKVVQALMLHSGDNTEAEDNNNAMVKMSRHSSGFMPTVEELQVALNERHLVLYFQPQLVLQTEQLFGVEALVRWIHPQFGVIEPDVFIAIAESSGLIEQLTSQVIDLAVKQSVKWQSQGWKIKISVNISAQNIVSLSMPEQLRDLVTSQQLDPSLLVLEVTESALATEVTSSLETLSRLRLKGFQLSIDDFGTGFSSMSQLHRVPFSELKVDRTFVKKMIEDSQSYAIVETCIMLGHKLNMTVVAEGIEDAQTMLALKNLDCDIAQGFFIAKPMTIEDFNLWYLASKDLFYDVD